METFREILQKAESHGVAIGHFNVADLTLIKAVFNAAHELQVPVVVGASEGERNFFGTRQLAAVVRSLRDQFDWPIFLNADHTHSLASALEAVNAGFDSVVFDLSALPFEENIRQTNDAIEALKSVTPSILIEGEIGDIGTGSEIHQKMESSEQVLTTAAEARYFVESTGVDILAPAVGNAHGMLQSMVDGATKKRLRIDRIREIKAATNVFLTLHGGSGTADADLEQAVKAGINVVHINTELRIAWRRGLEEGLAKQKSEVIPYKILPAAVESVQRVVNSRLRLLNNLH
jgi:fructose-bisphosphate aldolase class II